MWHGLKIKAGDGHISEGLWYKRSVVNAAMKWFLNIISASSPLSQNQGWQIWHPNWVRLAPHKTNLGLFKKSQNVLKLILKSPRFVPLGINVTKIWMPYLTSVVITDFLPDTPENCHLNVKSKNWQKLDIFFQKKAKIVIFRKKRQFMAIFWHSNGNYPEGQLLTKNKLPTTGHG